MTPLARVSTPRPLPAEQASLCTVHLGYLLMLIDSLRQDGVDVEAAFGADYLRELSALDPNTRRPIEEWEALADKAQAHCHRDVALLMAEFVKPWDTGPIGFITMASHNLREAAESLAQFYNLLNDVYILQAQLINQRFEIAMEPLSTHHSPCLERLTLATICWHARWLSRRADLRFDVHFAFPQPDATQLSALQKTFGGELRFDTARSTLLGPAEYELLPVSRGDHGVQETLRAQLMAEMAALQDASTSFVHKIERIIQPRLSTGEVTLDDIAAEAGVSVRTLQTRLEESGLNFRTLLDRMRHAQVLMYMGDLDISLIDMAHMLGFATQSSFHHAFKRWTGMTPGAYRKQRLKAGISNKGAAN
ncbi:MAG TPA: AraC family transcriptional regulator ligand-binding domain-containing protein [Aquabacterium sp.]|uniref:helix-turn-helix transcriptional regulator n=1 Tax=Aquabacterium sp. TaxID=1872578 RepID=UPI002E2EF68D|nr:AraC family transcriptional regulator ligand-binding domain-containing protein [Aquabacterium sp.]HEX5355301.1 AraC family transcriptional regulator ligand-binding domain-containing protein [Aquabacterium sp.]